jgi:hypothetical protein
MKGYNKSNSVSCSDWHLSWGLGTTFLGRIKKGIEPDTYLIKGHDQGRHGQIYNKPHEMSLKYTKEGGIETTHRLPNHNEVIKSIETLNNLK